MATKLCITAVTVMVFLTAMVFVYHFDEKHENTVQSLKAQLSVILVFGSVIFTIGYAYAGLSIKPTLCWVIITTVIAIQSCKKSNDIYVEEIEDYDADYDDEWLPRV